MMLITMDAITYTINKYTFFTAKTRRKREGFNGEKGRKGWKNLTVFMR